MLAKHKISVTQLHMMVFQVQFGTNLTQSISRSVTFKIVSKFTARVGLLLLIQCNHLIEYTVPIQLPRFVVEDGN